MTTKQHYFNSLQELAHKACNEPPNEELRPTELSSHGSTIGGTSSLAEAYEVVTDGWEYGRKIVTAMTEKYNEVFSKWFPKQDFSNVFVKSFSGGTVDIEAAIKGEPEDMLEIVQDVSKINSSGGQRGKLQRLIVNCDCSGGIADATILSRGGIIASLVNTLELAGFDTEVIVCSRCISSDGGSVDLTYYAIIKSFGSPLNLYDLAFALAHPAMLRRFIFSLNEQEPESEVAFNLIRRGYGRSADLTEAQLERYGIDTGVSLGYGNLYFAVITSNYDFQTMLDNCAKVVEKHFTTIKLGEKEIKAPKELGMGGDNNSGENPFKWPTTS